MKKVSNLSRYRKEKGLSQTELAKKSECYTAMCKFVANRENDS